MCVSSEIEIANTSIDRLPSSLHSVRLRGGVPIDHRIAFQPQNISVQEILAETNAELRRVLLERFGGNGSLPRPTLKCLMKTVTSEEKGSSCAFRSKETRTWFASWCIAHQRVVVTFFVFRLR